jgi:hypothetical protein
VLLFTVQFIQQQQPEFILLVVVGKRLFLVKQQQFVLFVK